MCMAYFILEARDGLGVTVSGKRGGEQGSEGGSNRGSDDVMEQGIKQGIGASKRGSDCAKEQCSE